MYDVEVVYEGLLVRCSKVKGKGGEEGNRSLVGVSQLPSSWHDDWWAIAGLNQGFGPLTNLLSSSTIAARTPLNEPVRSCLESIVSLTPICTFIEAIAFGIFTWAVNSSDVTNGLSHPHIATVDEI